MEEHILECGFEVFDHADGRMVFPQGINDGVERILPAGSYQEMRGVLLDEGFDGGQCLDCGYHLWLEVRDVNFKAGDIGA